MTSPLMLRTRVNNPERVFLNSSDDPRQNGETGFSQFTCTFQTPILGAKRTQLLRATIPNALVNIPDYQLCFFYYQLDAVDELPTPATLKCVRLYPSYYIAPGGVSATVNRYFSDPGDFVDTLNTASSAGGDDVTYNPFWEADDVEFTYNPTAKQIAMTGLTAGKFYAIAGWADPNVTSAINGQTIVMPNFNGGGTTPQPLVPNYTLNLRVGYAMSGFSTQPQVNLGTNANAQYANVCNVPVATGALLYPDSFPNLVYSQCVYLLANVVAGSGMGSNKTNNLLSVIPVNSPQLGITQYVAATINWLTKVPDTIYEIEIIMRDDANQPYLLPDNAQVNIEMGFYYKDD